MKLVAIFKPAKVTAEITATPFSVDTKEQIVREYVDVDTYEGEYTVTPQAEAVFLETTNKRLTDRIMVNPIPSNYGLITWDGTIITVS